MKKIIILLSLVSLVFSGCSETAKGELINPSRPEYLIPTQATIIKEYDRGWVEFELDGHMYLYQGAARGNYSYTSLTLIK